MRHCTAFAYGDFTAGQSFQDFDASLQGIVRINVYEIGGGQPMLRDEKGLLFFPDLRYEFRSVSFESGDEFRSHEVILK
jgi:hypothetical protein